MSTNWKSVVKSIAPTFFTLLTGNPLVGVGVRAAGEILLGDADADQASVEDALQTAILSGDPAALAKIKEIEATTKQRLIDAGVKLEEIDAADRDSARRRQVQMKDWTPNVLGILIIGGFFTILIAIIFEQIQIEDNPTLQLMLQMLRDLTIGVTWYFFGSSRGSKEKTEIIGRMK